MRHTPYSPRTVEEFAVKAGNMGYCDVFGAFHLAGTDIGAGTEPQLIHFCHHGTSPPGRLGFSLR